MAFPAGVTLSHILVVKDLAASVTFYRDVLQAALFREYGGTTAVFEINGAWLILVAEGGPTADKPDVRMVPPRTQQEVSHSMTFRVADCRAAYRELLQRGVVFLTPPLASEWDIRAFFRDLDGHLFEISQAKT